eukprot:scaffold146669_cov47-Attheya_sp.AAC.1
MMMAVSLQSSQQCDRRGLMFLGTRVSISEAIIVCLLCATTTTLVQGFSPTQRVPWKTIQILDGGHSNRITGPMSSPTTRRRKIACLDMNMVDSASSTQICTFDASDFALPTGEWPYSKADLNRVDNSDDGFFYDAPRFVTHIDEGAIQRLTDFYKEELTAAAIQKKAKKGDETSLDVLDLCSSWISHFPTDDSIPFGRVIGVGMNEEELAENKQLTEYYAQDLNKNPQMARFKDNSFDVVCNVVSVDYLTSPLEVFQEMHRILRPGGRALISFSNRCFPTKAIAMWLQADDIGRLTIVGSYFHYSAEWISIEALSTKDAIQTPKRPSVQEIMANPSAAFAWASTAAAVAKSNSGDPMFIVKGTK